jgi:hypothetical protein
MDGLTGSTLRTYVRSVDRLYELDDRRRSLVMLQPGSPSGLSREDAVNLISELQDALRTVAALRAAETLSSQDHPPFSRRCSDMAAPARASRQRSHWSSRAPSRISVSASTRVIVAASPRPNELRRRCMRFYPTPCVQDSGRGRDFCHELESSHRSRCRRD